MTIPYTKTTWATNDLVTAAKLNQIEQGVEDAQSGPIARVYHNAAQSISTATETTLAFNNERDDNVAGVASNQHDNSSNNSRLTCRYNGFYIMGAQIEWASAPTLGTIKLRFNGTAYLVENNSASTLLTCVTGHYLSVNDYVEVRVTQTSGGNLNVSTNANWTPEFWWARIG